MTARILAVTHKNFGSVTSLKFKPGLSHIQDFQDQFTLYWEAMVQLHMTANMALSKNMTVEWMLGFEYIFIPHLWQQRQHLNTHRLNPKIYEGLQMAEGKFRFQKCIKSMAYQDTNCASFFIHIYIVVWISVLSIFVASAHTELNYVQFNIT